LIREFDERAWGQTVYFIGREECTPFIGDGAGADELPLAASLAAALASEYDFPFEDHHNLAQVAQFAAVEDGSQFLKRRLADMFTNVKPPDFHAPDQPHALLADLRLPVYITTNYDDFMCQALVDRGREPLLAICPWYTTNAVEVQEATALFQEDAGYNPNSMRPIVYHLHGHYKTPQSLVVTEDDYIDFLVRLGSDPNLLPPVIQRALMNRMLLFVGYRHTDWTFRVIFRRLVSTQSQSSRHSHVSVQFPERSARIQEYLGMYFEEQKIRICWKSARDFSAELRRRWEER
jgi:hypothetical protein